MASIYVLERKLCSFNLNLFGLCLVCSSGLSKIQGFDDSSSNTSTTISTKDIKTLVDKLRCERNRTSTRNNYYGIWRNFNEFFIKLDSKPDAWEDRLILFVGYLISKEVKSGTIKSYISAIKSVLQEDGIILNEDRYLLTSLMKACRYYNSHVITRLPISKPLQHTILDETKNYFEKINQIYLNKLYRSLFVTVYYGMLRVSELTSGQHPIKARDVHIGTNKKKLLFILRTSKTHWKDNKPQVVKSSCTPPTQTSVYHNPPRHIVTNRQLYCPYAIIQEFVNARPTCNSEDEPFFVFADRSVVTPVHMRKTLKFILELAGFDHKLYSTHGFRTCRTVDLYKMNLSVETIRKIGRWSSNSVYTYLTYA